MIMAVSGYRVHGPTSFGPFGPFGRFSAVHQVGFEANNDDALPFTGE